ncbi:MAG: AAA family ATPase [Clostridiales bacterium]|nr:AAA family ATPase [Clostridiales bacterium]
MELKREIYDKLLAWKAEGGGRVLEVKGARQTGKTFIINKFARENYNNCLYINMLQKSGEDFLASMKKAEEWEPGQPRKENWLLEAFRLFDSSFEDNQDTVVVIDEVQESPKVYSRIREFAREFQCHFVVTGSYLGKVLEKDYFLPAGDMESLTLYTLSFEEFLDAFGRKELFEKIGLYGESSHEEYDELKSYYEIYCEIGGYPAVVMSYLEHRSVQKCRELLLQIIQIFIDESQRYFDDILEMNLFEQVFPAIAQTMVKEKKGSDDLITELSKIVFKEETNRVTKKSMNRVTAWLYRSHIIGFCGKANDCSPLNTTMNARFYFLDLGVCRYFLNIAGADPATIRGIVNENFVYIDLLKRTKALEIAGTEPMFGSYKEGEIDFLVNSRENYKNYAVEVKAGKTVGNSVRQLLKDGKVEAVYYLKGDTYGGVTERIVTIPIYLASRVKFDYEG